VPTSPATAAEPASAQLSMSAGTRVAVRSGRPRIEVDDVVRTDAPSRQTTGPPGGPAQLLHAARRPGTRDGPTIGQPVEQVVRG
jgi:hypothetical protein